jgi:hypothetical protein
MDPNANLKEQREIAKRILSDDGEDTGYDAVRLAELVEALDEWIMKGGFLPKEWREANEGFNHNK